MKKIPVSFTERQYILLNKEKKITGCSIASIIRNSIEQYFKNNNGGEDTSFED